MRGTRLVGALVVSMWLSACAGPMTSLKTFSNGTETLGSEFAAMSGTPYQICVHRVDAEALVLRAKGGFQSTEYRKSLEECERVAAATPSLVALGRALAAFGTALGELAAKSEVDYHDSFVDMTDAASTLALSLDEETKTAASSLLNTIATWATKGYTYKKLDQAIEESEVDVEATAALMRSIVGVYEQYLELYAAQVERLTVDPGFRLSLPAPLPGKDDDGNSIEHSAAVVAEHQSKVAAERERHARMAEAQVAAVRKHSSALAQWKARVETLKTALVQFKVAHQKILEEAKRHEKEWDHGPLQEVTKQLQGIAEKLAVARQSFGQSD